MQTVTLTCPDLATALDMRDQLASLSERITFVHRYDNVRVQYIDCHDARSMLDALIELDIVDPAVIDTEVSQ